VGILDAPSYTITQSDSLFAKKSRIRAAALQGALGATYSKSFPDIATATADIPTITVGTASVFTATVTTATATSGTVTYTADNSFTAGQIVSITGNTNKTATVTAATGASGTVTYTAVNTFAVGQIVSITGLTTVTGVTLNLSNQTIVTASSAQFTVSNSAVGTGTNGTATLTLNLSNQTIVTASATQFTVSNGVAGTGTYTATGGTANVTYKTVSLNDANLRFVSGGSTYSTANTRWKTPYQTTIDFVLNGNTVELNGVAVGTSNGGSHWIWVNGKPITATPTLYNAVSGLGAGGSFYVKLVFPDATPKQISFQYINVDSVYSIRCPITSSVSTAPQKLKGLYIGDSFFGGVTGIGQLNYLSAQIGRLLDTECANYGVGGSGYNSGSDYFGSSARIAYATAYQPDYIVICGSVNDDGNSGIGTAASTLYSALNTACPNVPIIVFGAQPSDSTNTISTNRRLNNNAVKTSALAASNVIAFYDMIGNVDGAVSAWSSATTYNTGDLVSYLGSIWKWERSTSATNIAPNGTTNIGWSLMTYLYTGTGRIGTTAGNGTRDLYLNSDAIHPSQDGATALANKMSSDIRSSLLKFALS
jgi:lysophospholipase L1-like esterase